MDQTEGWEQQPLQDITISTLKKKCESLIALRELKDKISEDLKGVNAEIDAIEVTILNILKENAMPNFKSELGTFSVKNNKSITQPEDSIAKRKLFMYLTEQGIFEEMVSVNSRTLNSWATKEIEAKEAEGVFGWVPPGLKPATEYQSLSVRKK